MLHKLLIAAAVAAAASTAAQAAVSLTGTSYSQNFDSLGVAETANPWTNDSTLEGWSLFKSTGDAITSLAAGDGRSSTGSFYGFGTSGSTERALGGLASGGAYFGSPGSGAPAGYIAASFSNGTGHQIEDVTLRFDGEQWRNGGNASAQSMIFQYGIGNTFSAVVHWTNAAAFNWSSPVVGASAAAVNGNDAGRVADVGGTFATPNWNSGSTLWLRWVEDNDLGNDHGLAIDNFSLSVSAVPEPAAYAMLLAGLGLLGLAARRRSK